MLIVMKNQEIGTRADAGSFSYGLCLFVALSFLVPQAYAANFAAGTGEPDDPYQIASAQHLISIGSDPDLLDRHFVLISDIDLDPNLPGGRVFSQALIAPDTNGLEGGFQGTPFGGRFDGNGFSISNLTISGKDNLGLFGEVQMGAQIGNLVLTQGNITGTGGRIGIIAGDNQGTVSHCYGSGTVSGFSEVAGSWGPTPAPWPTAPVTVRSPGATDVGGLVGSNRNKISNCDSSGMTSGVTFIGGLVGDNSGQLAVCSSDAAVSGTTMVGGLVGSNGGRNSRISNCHSTGMTAGVRRVGGLVGSNQGSVSLCYSQGTVSGEDEVGGLAGDNWGSVDGCYSNGAVSGENKVGGLVGSTVPVSNVSDCYSRGNVSGMDQVGGLIGFDAGLMTQCYSTGGVSGIGRVGGLVGRGNPFSPDAIVNNFWDIETSGSAGSAAGIGLTTDRMQDRQTFLDAGWDFVDEVDNGLHEIWRMPDEGGYPELDFFSESPRFRLSGQGTADDPYLTVFSH